MRKVCKLLLASVLALLLYGCGSSKVGGAAGAAIEMPSGSPAGQPVSAAAGDSLSVGGSSSPSSSSTQTPDSGPDQKLKQAARDIIDILRERDLERLVKTIDPEKGLLFSPYPHIDAKTDRIFKAAELPDFKNSEKLVWGSFDGSGDSINLTFRDYFEKFVYDQDFAGAPVMNVNKVTGKGNSPYNGQEAFPDASYVEFHFPGFSKSKEGMDWESLILVLRPAGQDWKLCAIVHGQWTI